MGSAPIAVPVLEYLAERHDLAGVVTQPDRPQGRKQVLTPTAVKAAAEARGLAVVQPRKLKAEEFLQTLREWNPLVIIVMAYGRLVPPAVLQLPPHGCINLHGSILPKHRGPCPIERGLMGGDPTTGITAFYMDEGFDTGDMIVWEEIPIGPDDTAGSLREKLARVAVRVTERTLDLLERGEAPRIPQDHGASTHAPIVERGEARLDFSETAEVLDRQVRACEPEPGAWTVFRGQPLKVRRAVPVADGAGTPGTISALDGSGPVVATGGGGLRLEEVQPAGKKWMSGAQFVAGYRPTVGERME